MKSIEIISIPVTDQGKAKEYVKLGFGVMVEAPFQGDAKWVQLGLPGNSGFTLPCLPGLIVCRQDVLMDLLSIRTIIENEREELAAKGITLGKTDQTPWGKFASIKDPDGNRLSLQES